MGTWSDDIFGNDLAADVRSEFREHLAAGLSAGVIVKKVRNGFAEPIRDADDRRTVWIALAAAMDEAGAVDPAVREQALKAIAWCEAPGRDTDRTPFGLEALAALRDKLGGETSSPAAKKPPKPKVPPGAGGEVLVIQLPGDEGGQAVVYVVGPSGHDRGDDAAKIVLLYDVVAEGLTKEAVTKALLAWRHYEQDWGNGTPGRSIGCYDASGKLPVRRTQVLLKDVPMPPTFERRMRGTGAVYRSADLPWVLSNDISDWNRCDWKIAAYDRADDA